MKFKKILLFLFITVVGFCGVISANALTISDDGKYTLILTSSDGDVSIDGASEKIIRFNVNEHETTVKLSELTKKLYHLMVELNLLIGVALQEKKKVKILQ